MMESYLQFQFAPLERVLRRTRFWWKLAWCWAITAMGGVLLLLLKGVPGLGLKPAFIVLAAGAITAGAIIWRRESRRPTDFKDLAAVLEREDPQVRHLLSAALEQEPDPHSQRFGFLQWRVIHQVLAHSNRPLWRQRLKRRWALACWTHWSAFASVMMVAWILAQQSGREHSVLSAWFAREIEVVPGDATIERGTSLVITARFGRRTPAESMLVLVSASGLVRRIPMQQQFADPVFGTSLLEIAEDGLYHIEYADRETRDYRITVFDYPELIRADAALDYPEYTRLTNRVVPDTRRITAVEGTRLDYLLQLNKPVVRARLLAGAQSLELEPGTNATARLRDFPLVQTARYALELVDNEGRTNKVPADFSVQVLPNHRPELKFLFPRGDQRVSRLQELELNGEAADDFGLVNFGIGYGLAGGEPRMVNLGESAPASVQRRLEYLIDIEQLGAEVEQVMPYFIWADDYGPDGKVRRTFSDIYFAEIRPFEEVYRRDQSGGAGGQGEGAQQGQATRLAQFQKEIVIATWKLHEQRPATTPSGANTP